MKLVNHIGHSPALLVSLICAVGAGCSFAAGVQGSGVAKSETRQVAAFTKVVIDGAADVTVNVDPKQPQSVSITTDDNLLPIIETSVRDNTLIIKSKQSYSSKSGVKLSISIAQFDGGEIDGSGGLTAHGVAGKSFYASVNGSGDVKVDGAADSLKIRVAGSGDVDATKLAVADADVSITGSGDAQVNAGKNLNAQVTGSGDVRYAGSPQVSKQITGSGSVKQNRG